MLVLLFWGIVLVITTRCIILSDNLAISAGVSYTTPLGGAVKASSVGFAEWQDTHRLFTISVISPNFFSIHVGKLFSLMFFNCKP